MQLAEDDIDSEEGGWEEDGAEELPSLPQVEEALKKALEQQSGGRPGLLRLVLFMLRPWNTEFVCSSASCALPVQAGTSCFAHTCASDRPSGDRRTGSGGICVLKRRSSCGLSVIRSYVLGQRARAGFLSCCLGNRGHTAAHGVT